MSTQPNAMAAFSGLHPGPCLFFDLVRSARKGRTTLLRIIYAAVLLAALWLGHQSYFPHRASFNSMADYAERFVQTILVLQLGAAIFLTPAFVAGAVAEEKENGALYLLLTTHLTRRDIVLGKLLSRLFQVGAVLLVSLPIFSLVQLWGGIDVRLVLSITAITALLLCSIGSISIAMSSLCRTAWGALVASYVTLLLLFALVQCTAALGDVYRILMFKVSAAAMPKAMLIHLALHGVIALIALGVAITALRAEPSQLSEKTAAVVTRKRRHLAHIVSLRPGFLLRMPRLRHDPLLWKETYHGDWLSWFIFFLYLPPLALFVFNWLITELQYFGQEQLKHDVFHSLVMWNACLTCAAIGFRAAGIVVRERQRGTLDALLTLPVPRRDILRAKWWGSLRQARWLGVCLGLVFFTGLFIGALPPFGCLVFAVVIAVHVTFLTTLALFLSVVCRSRTQANILLGLAVFVLVAVAPLLIRMRLGYYDGWTFAVSYSVSPVETWWWLLAGRGPIDAPVGPSFLLGIGIYGALTWFFWRLGLKRFAAESKDRK